MDRHLIIMAALLGALGVGIGAFGAHGLEATLTANGRADTFETGVQYHMYHALALLGAAWFSTQVNSRLVQWAGYLFVLGVLLFSGSLYVLAIFNVGIMGAVAPLGGTAFIAGWACLGVAAWQNSPAKTSYTASKSSAEQTRSTPANS